MPSATAPTARLLITMISDDNFNSFLQRTVLLEFALAPDASERAEKEEAAPKNAAARDP